MSGLRGSRILGETRELKFLEKQFLKMATTRTKSRQCLGRKSQNRARVSSSLLETGIGSAFQPISVRFLRTFRPNNRSACRVAKTSLYESDLNNNLFLVLCHNIFCFVTYFWHENVRLNIEGEKMYRFISRTSKDEANKKLIKIGHHD